MIAAITASTIVIAGLFAIILLLAFVAVGDEW